MKKRQPLSLVTILIFVAVLFIPSYIAIATYRNIENAPPDISEAKHLELSDIDGAIFGFLGDDVDGKAVIDLFSAMISGATRVDSLPVSDGTPCYLASFGAADNYQFYFSKTGDSYMLDATGKTFRIPTEQVSRFLATPYAAALFATSKQPQFTVNDGTSILPTDITWRYRANKENTLISVNAASLKKGDSAQTVESDGSFDFGFSLVPNRTIVNITDEEGRQIYSGSFINDSYTRLGRELNITESTMLSVTLTAEWNEAADLDYSGTATFRFTVDFSAPAEFSLGESSVIRGGIVVLKAKNVKHADRITFSSSPALTAEGGSFTPVFYSDGRDSYAIIMTDYNTEEKGFDFTVGYGAVTTTLHLDVATRAYRSGYTSSVSQSIARQTHSTTAISAFRTLVSGLVSQTSKTALFSGVFAPSLSGNLSYALGFGHSRTITATGDTFQNDLVDYYCAAGTPILAAQDGVVLYCGVLDYPGKFVVVDHGLGLFTVYMHLGEFNVKVGDTVRRGAVLGTAGTTGFIASQGANHSIMYLQNGYAFCGYELEERALPGLR